MFLSKGLILESVSGEDELIEGMAIWMNGTIMNKGTFWTSIVWFELDEHSTLVISNEIVFNDNIVDLIITDSLNPNFCASLR